MSSKRKAKATKIEMTARFLRRSQTIVF